MNDAAVVRGLQRVGDLACDGDRVTHREGARPQSVRERAPLDELHDEELRAVGGAGRTRFLEPIERGNVRMTETGENLRLALEAFDTFRVVRRRGGQGLDRHIATEPRIARAIHLPHAPGAQRRADFIWTEAGSWCQRH